MDCKTKTKTNTYTYIIFGAKGYIGAFLSHYLRSNGHRVIGYSVPPRPCNLHTSYDSGSVSDPGEDHFFSHPDDRYYHSTQVPEHDIQEADIIIYLAGSVGRATCSQQPFSVVYKNNVLDVADVLNKCSSNQIFIYASTASVLEGYDTCLGKEDDELNVSAFDEYTLSMHQREKYINELVCSQKIKAKRVFGLRFGTVIGISPCQRFDYVHIGMLKSACLGGVINVVNPNTKRSFLWNKDLSRVIDALSNQNRELSGSEDAIHEIYNIASYNCSISDVANAIAEKTGAFIKYNYRQTNNSSPKGFTMDTTKFTNAFGFKFEGDFNAIFDDLSANFAKLLNINDIYTFYG